MGISRFFGAALGFGLAALAATSAMANDTGLTELDTDDLRLLYYDPDQTYLTPYVAQAFENSMAYHEKKFD